LSKLERTLDKAVSAITQTTNVNTDSILSVPEHLLRDDSFISHTTNTQNVHSMRSPSENRRPHSRQTDSRPPSARTIAANTDSGYKYTSLRGAARPAASYTDSRAVLEDLGLTNTQASPPRRFNPPAEKLTPSPQRFKQPTG